MKTQTSNEPCTCEHAAHFHDENKLTPNGNPGHRYNQKFHPRAMRSAHTPSGTFRVCLDCARDCYAEFVVS